MLAANDLPGPERAAVEALLGPLAPETVELLRLPAATAPADLPHLPGPDNGNRIVLQNGHVVQLALDAVADTEPLRSLPELVDVAIDGPFEALQLDGMRELRTVAVHALREPSRPVRYEFSDLPRIEQLISNGRAIRELVVRGPLPALASLTLANSDLSTLPGLDAPALHTLDLSSNPLVDLASLARFPELERLQLDNVGLESTAGLPGLPELLSLDLDGNPLSAIDTDLAARLPSLRRLSLRRTTIVAPPEGFEPDVRIDLDEGLEFETLLTRLRQSNAPRNGQEFTSGPTGTQGRMLGRSGRCTWRTSTFSRARVSCELTVDQLRGAAAVELGTTDAAMPFQGGGTPRVQVRLSTQKGSARVLVRTAFDLVATARLLAPVDEATADAARLPGDAFDGYLASAPASPESPSTVRGEPTLLGDRVVLWLEQVSDEPVEGLRLVVDPVD